MRMAAAAAEKCFNIIVATTRKGGIGYQGKLPWASLPEDMRHFKTITGWNRVTQPAVPAGPLFYQSGLAEQRESIKVLAGKRNAVIMGKATWDSLPEAHRPLKSRLNIVLARGETSSIRENADVKCANSFSRALELAQSDASVHEIFVIGGANAYEQALAHADRCKAIYLTRAWKDFPADRFFPPIPRDKFSLAYISKAQSTKKGAVPLDFTFYVNSAMAKSQPCIDPSILALYPRNEEMQYLELVKKVIGHGNEKQDRTGTGTKSLFGSTMRFDLSQTFPLLTTKSVYWKGVVEELLWFLRGQTDSRLLSDKGVKIWDGNGSREFLDRVGLREREVGDLGPVYGFQWRHFGAEYRTMRDQYAGKGVDQLRTIVDQLRNNPDDRRILLSAWNPAALPKMALPPCHVLAQFYVANQALSCTMYQRSADLGLGVPFNIASYSLLTHVLASAARLKPGEFVHVLGDTHVYKNHILPLKEQLRRYPNPFPVMRMKKRVETVEDIEKLQFEDFELKEYVPHPKIKMDLSC